MSGPADSDDEGLRVGQPKKVAAGVPGVVAATRIALRQMGAVRTGRTLLHINQADGFDCPGCAWPEPAASQRGHLEFCENGAKAVAEEATKRRVTAAFFAEHSVAELAGQSDYWLGQQGRLTEPMVKRSADSHYRPIAWDDAFGLIADELNALDSPDEAAFYTSGRTSNEAAFLYQLFVRQFGTNNLPDCSNMCHESSGVALTEAIGIGKGSVTLEDFAHTDLIIVVGQNPGTNHPRMLTALEEAKANGARIVAMNPLPEAGLIRFKNPQRAKGVVGAGTPLADLFLQVRVNGDLALFQALNRALVLADDERPGSVLDCPFIEAFTDGFHALAASLRAADVDELLGHAGLSERDLRALVDMVLAADRIIVCWAMGLTQHRNAVATIREVMNFLLLRGNIGRPGAGACPVRGHSNVQGDRTMGIYEKPSASFLDALAAEFDFDPPRAPGLDTVDSIHAMEDGRVKVFMGMGGNFVSATPDTERTIAAVQRCRLTVQVSTKLNRSHTATGDIALILPCLGRTETDRQAAGDQAVTVEDSMGAVHRSQGRLAPASEQLLSEPAIVCEIAARTLGPRSSVDWAELRADYRVVRDHISRVVPGFEDFNARVDVRGGFHLPHPPRDERRFTTPNGRAQFTVNALRPVVVPEGHLLLQTVRSHDQYNTTIYGLDDRYRGIHGGRRVVFVHTDDCRALGVAEGQRVDLVSEFGGVERRAAGFRVVAYPTAPGTCAAYFPEANPVVPLESTADESNTPTSKSVVIRLEPSAASG